MRLFAVFEFRHSFVLNVISNVRKYRDRRDWKRCPVQRTLGCAHQDISH